MDTELKVQQREQLEQLEVAIARLNRSLAARGGGEGGLSPSQRIVLRALEGGPLQISEVAGTLSVTLSAATGLVDRMVRTQLVTRERDNADRRVVWVRVTDAGRRALADAERVRRDFLAEAVQSLSEGELQQLVGLLGKLST